MAATRCIPEREPRGGDPQHEHQDQDADGVELLRGHLVRNGLVLQVVLISGDRLLAQIVIGGAETAGGDDDVRPRKSKLQRLPQALRVISYHALVIDVDPQSRQLLGDVAALVLTMSPIKISVPMQRISALCCLMVSIPSEPKYSKFIIPLIC